MIIETLWAQNILISMNRTKKDLDKASIGYLIANIIQISPLSLLILDKLVNGNVLKPEEIKKASKIPPTSIFTFIFFFSKISLKLKFNILKFMKANLIKIGIIYLLIAGVIQISSLWL